GIASAMNRSVGWLFSWPIAILAIVLVGYAGHVFVNHWDRFYTGMRMVMSDGNWISLGIVTIALKLIHECGHMLMCKRYGGHVGGWGVMLLLLIPMPYVDVTSAWRFESKRARILVSAAGMMVEVVLAAIATLVWAATSTGEINQIAYNVMISASMVTLMFNINPLMRFDGYYMLSDALDLPNLANQGQQYLTDIGRQIFFGQPARTSLPFTWRGLFIRAYGVAAFLWRITISLSLMFGAAALRQGIGVIIAAISLVLWLGVPMYKLCRYAIFGGQFDSPRRMRFLAAVLTCACILVAAATYLPSPATVTAPVVIECDPLTTIRAQTAGFIDEVLVSQGDNIQPGQTLVRLHNPELESEIRELQAQINELEVQSATALSRGDITAHVTIKESHDATYKQLQDALSRKKKLVVSSDVAGSVLSSDLHDLQGRHVQRGEMLMHLGETGRMKGLVMLTQQDAKTARTLMGTDVRFRLFGHWHEPHTGLLRRVNPRASVTPPHPAFGMPGGAMLPVVQSAHDPSEQEEEVKPEELPTELVRPRVVAEIELDETLAADLRSGQHGQVRLSRTPKPLGQYLYTSAHRWLREKLTNTHGL
ncbi:MAG: efflux RND transporter periplasmic adaptor subunit, partial [Planctomycetota bacterium]